MPFTPAHPTLVLPLLKRTRLSAIGLVVGSIAPDFEYFFKMEVNSVHSHTLAGLIYFDVPVTFLLTWVFIRYVRDNLIRNLPAFIQVRFRPLMALDLKRTLITNGYSFALSALLGSLSHLFWDGFTHNNTFFVRHLSFYKGAYIPYEGVKYPLWYALQHISSATGLAVVLAYIFFLPRIPGRTSKPSSAYWMVVFGVAVIIVSLRFAIWPRDLKEGNAIVSAMAGLCYGLIIGGVINFRNRTREAKRDG